MQPTRTHRAALLAAVLFALTGAACGGGGDSTPANRAPVANAGPNQAVATGATVTLDGSGSADPDGDPLTFAWLLVSKPVGSTAALSATSTVAPAFTADLEGTYAVILRVNDGTETSLEDTVLITATRPNVAPVANAGPDQAVTPGTLVTLDGSGSSDGDGDALTYAWSITSKPLGSTASLASATAAAPTFTAGLAGTYVLSLVVNDGRVGSAADEVTIVANTAPVADAGPDQLVGVGTAVALDGSGSADPDGDALTYAWSITSKPGGSTAALSSAAVATPTFTADLEGAYVLSLTVHDGKVSSAPDEVTIMAGNVAPVADAGDDRSVLPGWVVTLDGSGSSDANGDALAYAWSIASKPAGSTATLSDAAALSPSFTADVVGTYTVTLTVNDGELSSAADEVTVTAVVAAEVADTLQTISYTSTVFGEDHDYATRTPSCTPNGDGTVTDNVTTLVWQQVDDLTRRTWADAATFCASLGLPGSGWRLPTAWELVTLMFVGKAPPIVNETCFPGTQSIHYWASLPGSTAGTAWAGSFANGQIETLNATVELAVRCVRGGPIGPALLDNADGTVTDAARGLTWQQADDGVKKTWYDALTYCEGLTLGGVSDWRVPNVKELISILDHARSPPFEQTFFPSTQPAYYWSSTTERTWGGAWQASFQTGKVTGVGGKAYANDYARCVRGGL